MAQSQSIEDIQQVVGALYLDAQIAVSAMQKQVTQLQSQFEQSQADCNGLRQEASRLQGLLKQKTQELTDLQKSK